MQFLASSRKDLGFIPAKAGFKALFGMTILCNGEAGAAFAVSHGSNGTSLLLSPTIGYATNLISLFITSTTLTLKINNNGTKLEKERDKLEFV
jgi:hypothetical protein